MSHLVFFLEELSMKEFLNILLPKILPQDVTFTTIAHRGKNDLKKSIPRKLRAWGKIKEQKTYFAILRDQDGGDCIEIKNSLFELCTNTNQQVPLIRIVCQGLESWFLGDLLAVEKAFKLTNLAKMQNKEKFRNPDILNPPSQTLEKLVKNYQKVSGARSIAKYMDIKNNRSPSFNAFLKGVGRLTNPIAK